MYLTIALFALVFVYSTLQFRGVLSHHMLNRTVTLPLQVDTSRALIVQHGSDSFHEMGKPAPQFMSAIPAAAAKSSAVQCWVAASKVLFPPSKESSSSSAVKEPTLSPEPLIDGIIAQKNEEYIRLRREVQLKRKLALAETQAAKSSRAPHKLKQ
jgi:hypothetical protein